MFFLSLFRALKLGWQNFYRNLWLSLVTIFILILTLFLISLLGGVKIMADKTISSVKDKVDMSVYFEPDANQSEITSVKERLENMSEVRSVEYISPDQALIDFKERNRDNSDIISALESLDHNPFGAMLVIKTNRLEDYPAVLTVVEEKSYQDIIQDEDKDFENNQLLVAKLNNITGNINKFGFIIVGIFIAIVVIVIFNTIRITIYSYREEIGIMKLVGASNNFVKAPFVVESIIYGLIAALISMILIYTLLNAFSPFMEKFFSGYNINIVEYFNQKIFIIIGFEVLVAVLISSFSSLIAIRRYLKV